MIKNFLKSHSIHKKIVPSLDFFMLLRPTLFFSVWVMICIGMYIASILNNNPQMNVINYSMHTTALFLGVSFVCGSTFILNQIADIESDKINKKIFLLNEIIAPEKALSISKIVNALGFFIVLFIDWLIVFPLLFIFIIWGITYNNKQFNWKGSPWLGLFSNLMCGYLLILCGMIFNRSNIEFHILLVNSIKYIIPFIFAYASIVLLANIPDRYGDEVIDKKTLTVILGDKTTVALATFLCVLSFLVGIYIREPLSSTASLTSIPFFLFALFRGKRKDVIRAIRYPIFLLNFYVLTIYPLLIFPILIFYYVSKYYYWHRFSIHYPTLLVDND